MYDEEVRQALGSLRVGEARSDGPLCVLPLTSDVRVKARYVLLEQALSRGTMSITEVSDGGSVPYLRAVNKGPWPVLIFDGEELVGAKQNRIANATILVAAGESILPVSCVEQGRWSARSRAFSGGSYASHPGLRQAKERQVRERAARVDSRQGTGDTGRQRVPEEQHVRASRFMADQGRVWGEVDRTSRVLGASSPTSAMADVYESGRAHLEQRMDSLLSAVDYPAHHVMAVMVFLGGRFVCLDVLRPAKRFARLYPKLLRGYALESRLRPARTPKGFDPEEAALRVLAELTAAQVQAQPAADLGEDVRVETKGLSGAGLVWQDELVQLSVFEQAA